MGRLIAIDYGTKRTGIAITDELQLIASEKVDVMIVGEPKQKDGTHSDVEVYIQKFLKKFTKVFPALEIIRVDESYTSKMAFQTMIDSGLKKMQRRNKALIDEISATIILQDYLYNK